MTHYDTEIATYRGNHPLPSIRSGCLPENALDPRRVTDLRETRQQHVNVKGRAAWNEGCLDRNVCMYVCMVVLELERAHWIRS